MTATALHLDVTFTPAQADLNAVETGLDAYNASFIGDERRVAVFLRDDEGRVVGGIVGWIVGKRDGYVSQLWVSNALRGHGHGSALLKRMEALAVEHGCERMILDTFAFQAPDFYIRHGYREIGRITDFFDGHGRVWFRKQLREAA